MYYLSTNQLIPDSVPADFKQVIEEHIAWINRQIENKVILQAGKWGDTRGMCLIKAGSRKDAEKILSEDPLIRSGAVSYLLDEYFSNVPLE